MLFSLNKLMQAQFKYNYFSEGYFVYEFSDIHCSGNSVYLGCRWRKRGCVPADIDKNTATKQVCQEILTKVGLVLSRILDKNAFIAKKPSIKQGIGMGKTAALLLVLALLMVSLATTAKYAGAQFLGLVTIKADGTVEPTNAPIQQIGEVYVITEDIESIRVEKSNIVLDGNGYTVPGDASSLPRGVSSYNSGVFLNTVINVTVKNLIVQNVAIGIFLDRSAKCVITNNTIRGTHVAVPELQYTAGIFIWAGNSNNITENQLTNNYDSIYLGYNSQQNKITQNNITNSGINGVIFWDASNNVFYHNNFVDNAMQVSAYEDRVNVWDNGSVGNFWSDYLTKYPNASEIGSSGIGDTPYIINASNIDNYPLMYPYDIEKNTIALPTPETEPEPFPTMLVVASVITVAVVSVGLLVYFKKRKIKI